MSNVLYVTKCFYLDYKRVLTSEWIRRMVLSHNHKFESAKIWLNNFNTKEDYLDANDRLAILTKENSDLNIKRLSVAEVIGDYAEVWNIFCPGSLRWSVCEWLTLNIENQPVCQTTGDAWVETDFDWVSVALKILDRHPEI